MKIIKDYEKEELEKLLIELKSKVDIQERFSFLFKTFEGRSYISSPLSNEKEEEKPVLYLKKFDCFTLVETTLSLIINTPKTEKEVVENLIKLRYKNKVISFNTRNHYSSLWAEENSDVLNDITPLFKNYYKVIKNISYIKSLPERKVILNVLSFTNFLKNMKHLKNGDILLFLSEDIGEIDYFHMAFLNKTGDEGKIFHASKKFKRVINENVKDFFNRTFHPPVTILRLKNDTTSK